MRRLAVLVALMAAPLAAQNLPYTDAVTLGCLQYAADHDARRACIGLSSAACMNTPAGGSTVGMGGCLDAELQLWDRMLNENYRQRMSRAKQADIDTAQQQYGGISQAETLRDMQRAWITFRDASCTYERSKWGGGTGGGPATLACLMEMTGAQALALGQEF